MQHDEDTASAAHGGSALKGVVIALSAGLAIAAASLVIPHLGDDGDRNDGGANVDRSMVILREPAGPDVNRTEIARADTVAAPTGLHPAAFSDLPPAGFSATDAPTYADMTTASLFRRDEPGPHATRDTLAVPLR